MKYLFDGECQVCRRVKGLLERNDAEKKVKFVDISSLDYNPKENAGISPLRTSLLMLVS